MHLSVNGHPRDLPAGTTLHDVVVAQGGAGPRPRGFAAAVNEHVVPATAWSTTVLADGDVVEVVTAYQGG